MRFPHTLFLVICWSSAFSIGTPSFADEPPLLFDAPPVLGAVPTESDGTPAALPGAVRYEIVIPVSTLVMTRQDLPPYQVWCFCRSPQFPWQVVDYQPRTELTTPYVEPLQIDRQRETSHRVGINLTGRVESWGTAFANSELAGKEKETRRVTEAPPMMLLQASGTIDRGTGVYFKFRPSPQTTQEGSRDLRITVETPATWRGSILRLTCRAEPIDSRDPAARFGEAVFAIAVHRAGDKEAASSAVAFANAERKLRQVWFACRKHRTTADHDNAFRLDWIPSLLRSKRPHSCPPWSQLVDRIVFTADTEQAEESIRGLPKPLQASAHELLAARKAFDTTGREGSSTNSNESSADEPPSNDSIEQRVEQ